MSCYLLIDGVLSVFVFPILIMEWSKRIGGCISATEETGSGTFWGTVLLIRALFVVSGIEIGDANIQNLSEYLETLIQGF
ncbi:hypothetical protein FSP39_019314 [Pinctada imbricata]|uniref:Uncharacterized protein n=1 Tax=Pinctada imbricata TaxID=66713 RepID=A0AA88Y5D3_PINIB|nr:hypothetical protein FSP39_019314 [Pinctada imbricata]